MVTPSDTWDAQDFVIRHRSMVRSAIRQVVTADSDVDDIEQETFASLIRMFRRGIVFDNIGGYVWRTARNMAVAHVRRETRQRLTADRVGRQRMMPMDSLDSEPMSNDLRGALLGLSLETRWAMWSTTVDGCLVEDVAAELGLRANVLSARLYRARREIRRAMANDQLAS